MTRKKIDINDEEYEEDDDDVFGNATEYINTFKLTVPKELEFVKEYDWSSLESLSDRKALFEMQSVQTTSAVNHAEYLYKLSGGDPSPTSKKWITMLLEFFDVFEERATRYCNSSKWKENFKIENIAETKQEPIFNSEINGLLGRLKKRVAKLRVDKHSFLDLEVRKGFTPSMAMFKLMTDKHPEILKYIKFREKKYN